MLPTIRSKLRASAPLALLALLWLGSAGCPTKKPGQCKTDKDCKAGEKCVAGKCQACATDKDCGPGKTCLNGTCRPKPGYCNTTKECPDGKVCRDHLCQACQKDTECPSGKCDKGRCAESMAGTCKEDDDCKDEEVCKDGKCVPAPKPYSGPALCPLKTVYFAFNKAEIRPSDQKVLEQNARCILSVKERKVHLNGHCDPRGTEEYNLALSNRRAQAVKRYLERLGVPGSRLHVVPKGELEATGTDEASWFKDRRVAFIWY
jgi:peptidoglycan-associated lipoprotein